MYQGSKANSDWIYLKFKSKRCNNATWNTQKSIGLPILYTNYSKLYSVKLRHNRGRNRGSTPGSNNSLFSSHKNPDRHRGAPSATKFTRPMEISIGSLRDIFPLLFPLLCFVKILVAFLYNRHQFKIHLKQIHLSWRWKQHVPRKRPNSLIIPHYKKPKTIIYVAFSLYSRR